MNTKPIRKKNLTTLTVQENIANLLRLAKRVEPTPDIEHISPLLKLEHEYQS